MARIFGLDFGTTNSLATVVRNNKALPLLDPTTNRPHPSAIWYRSGSTIVGREARARLGDPASSDDIEKSPKAHLGKSGTFFRAGVERSAADAAAEVLRYIRNEATSRQGFAAESFDRAVVTIPVGLGGKGRRELRDAALKAGIHVHQFVHEPLAALYGWLRRHEENEFSRLLTDLEGKLVLVFDWGGGTLDLTLCRCVGGDVIQVLNKFDNTVGGDLFDEQVGQFVRDRHARRHGLQVLPAERAGAAGTLLSRCEQAKIDLTERDASTILVTDMYQSGGAVAHVEEKLTRADLLDAVGSLIDRGLRKIDELLEAARIRPEQIARCLATGGMVQIPAIRSRLLEKFGPARVPLIQNGDHVISEGAAWIAHDERRVRLAKPFELVHADDERSFLTIFRADMALPSESQASVSQTIGVYCIDPQDGLAKLQFVRPRFPGQESPSDPRDDYLILSVRVDHTAKPLRERINIDVEIDQDFIVTVSGKSDLMLDRVENEIYDLEFGLALAPPEYIGGQTTPTRKGVAKSLGQSGSVAKQRVSPLVVEKKHHIGAIRIRPNIAADDSRIDLIPGEIIELHFPGYFISAPITPQVARQRDEQGYYRRCAVCTKKSPDIVWNGCDQCAMRGIAYSRAEAKRRREAGENLWIERRN